MIEKNEITFEDVKNTAENGCYPGRIINMYKFVNKYNLKTVGIVTSFSHKNTLVEIAKYVEAKLCEGSELHEILDNMNMLPKLGQKVDLNKMIGKPVLITIENNEKNGKVYSNIVDIELDTDAGEEEILFDEKKVEAVFDDGESEDEETEDDEEIKEASDTEKKPVMPKRLPVNLNSQRQPRERKISPR